MSLFIETILVKAGRARNLSYHQQRIDRTFRCFFSVRPFRLESLLRTLPDEGTYRCRLTYSKTVESLEFIPYSPVKKSKLLALESDLNYNYKFQERGRLQSLLENAQKSGCDDALIVRNGLVTDTTIANIAFFDGRRWITPTLPLLRGTARARLLEARVIVPGRIGIEEVGRFSHFALMNALSGFYVAGTTENIER